MRRAIFFSVIGLGGAAILGLSGWLALGWFEPVNPPRGVEQPRKIAASKITRADPWPDDAEKRLASFEERLAKLHGNAVDAFIDAEGFGMSRMIIFHPYDRQGQIPPEIVSSEGLEREPKVERLPLDRLHLLSALDFVKTGDHESRKYQAMGRYRVSSLDLVGLLKHEAPVAYLTKTLPTMEQLREAPTRPLDTFERLALERLQAGDDLFIRSAGAHLRMVGSLRATKECLRCHDGERGDLLGAFSYVLTDAARQ